MELYESGENYLEAILMLQQKKGEVRSIDVVNLLNYSKPSVSVAMKKLRENGYIEMDESGYITLTSSGAEIAHTMMERHQVLSDWFISLGIPVDIAINDACRLEHYLSSETFEGIKAHIDRSQKNQ